MIQDFVIAHYISMMGCYFASAKITSETIEASSPIKNSPIWNHLYVAGVRLIENELSAYETIYVDDASPLRTELDAKFPVVDREIWMRCKPHTNPEVLPLITGNLEVKRITWSDIASLSGILDSAFGDPYGRVSRQHFQSRRSSDQFVHFGLFNRREMVSLASAYRACGFTFVHNVSTRPECRGRGYATTLLWRIMTKELPAAELSLQVEATSGAKALYERLGFEQFFSRTGFDIRA